jgi:hypothetical protein
LKQFLVAYVEMAHVSQIALFLRHLERDSAYLAKQNTLPANGVSSTRKPRLFLFPAQNYATTNRLHVRDLHPN